MHKVILFGSGKENIEFKYMNDRGDTSVRRHPFEGVLHNMERRYKETESSAVREELAKFISNRSCAPVKARVCVAKRVMSLSKTRRCRPSQT